MGMYKAFYGLQDNPFSIVPNPHYLFLSDRHREALAHLTYGLKETGGFVLLTGEVGTGKTTISRALLGSMPQNTNTPFILNPSLSAIELMAAMCDQLKIPYSKDSSLKQFNDLLTQYLISSHQLGRRTVLIIDEAQHLKPEVLEQLRLLTNLETDTEKLLQIILIGQPELQELLKQQELRQLAQRITARYHLLPLNGDEVGLYVEHRLQVAGRSDPLFTTKAIAQLQQMSGGIPRVINLICERALMAGYAHSRVPIDQQMVQEAAIEVLGLTPPRGRHWWPLVASGGLAFVLAFTLVWQLLPHPSATSVTEVAPHQAPSNAQVSDERGIVSGAGTHSIGRETASYLPHENVARRQLEQAMATAQPLDTAFNILLGLWHKSPYEGMTPCQSAKAQGLACYQQQGNWQSIIRLNYPAVVYLEGQGGRDVYAALVALKHDRALLQFGEQQFWVSRDWFEQHFSGVFEILWQPEPGNDRPIGPESAPARVQWLEDALARVDNNEPRRVSGFDSQLSQRLMAFQRQHGLSHDGIAGKQTLQQLALYLSEQGPRLTAAEYF